MAIPRQTPPAPDEIELSVFGPGLGESVLTHIGNGKWIVVDSCLDCESGRPSALQYLENIQVNPATAVKLVVATHWHDDHIKGLGELLRTCKSAEFACSGALGTRDFLQLIEAYRTSAKPVRDFSGLKEFGEVIQELQSRKESHTRLAAPRFAIENSCIWQDIDSKWQVVSLSPSSASFLQAQVDIHNYLTTLTGSKQSLIPKIHNHFSVVLWVTNGVTSLLFGADLEETGDRSRGWSAVLASNRKPQGKASAFKIPHHGSPNGHLVSVWHDMLEPSPLSIVTPWVRGGRHLPSKADLQRIIGFTQFGFATAPPSSRTPQKPRPSEVEKRMRKTVKFIKEVNYLGGHVRARASMTASGSSSWNVNLFGSALTMKSLELQL